MQSLPFDVAEARKTNILISGANASGKTRLACSIASKLNNLGYVVIVFDISGVWRKLSDLPLYVIVEQVNGKIKIPPLRPDQTRIFDLSRLKLSEVKQVVDALSLRIWNEQIHQPNPKQTFLFIEEAEGFLRNIRSNDTENIYRIVHVGRNTNIRCTLITSDLALIDPSVIRLCGIRFHGFLNPEENSKRKFRAYYGIDWVRIAYETLDAGTFIRFRQYEHKNPLDVKTFKEFKPKTTPRLYYKKASNSDKLNSKKKEPSIFKVLYEIAGLPIRWLDGGGYTSWDNVDHIERLKEERRELEEGFIIIK